MIIFGTRTRRSTIEEGTFFCPRCGGDREYTKLGVRRWFTLFFIPIFPIGAVRGPRVVCKTCNGAFDERVLSAPAGDARIDAQRTAFKWCATAVFEAGDASSAIARAALGRVLIDRGIELHPGDELVAATPDQLAVYAAPVANQLSEPDREAFFAGCGTVALADGELSDGESDALRNLGEALHLSEAHRAGILHSVTTKPEGAAGS